MKSLFRGKNIVFALIAVMTAYVLYHNERFLIEPANPIWQHYAPFKWWLLVHGLAGANVLLLAPLQFSERLRKRFTKLHRVSGRFYVAGVVILAPLGIYIQYRAEQQGGPRSFTILAGANAFILIGATLIAITFAIKRKILLHRQWMTRSYAIGLVFFEGRFIGGITGWENLGIEIVQAIIWSCLTCAVLFADVANNWNEIRGALSTQPKPKTAPQREVPDALGEAS